MKVEVIVKLVLELEEYEGPTTDNGLNDMLDYETVQHLNENVELTFQSDADEDINCTLLEGDIDSVKKLENE